MLTSSLTLAAILAASALSSPLSFTERRADAEKCKGVDGPFLSPTFPDPSLIEVDGTYWSFGTYNGKDVQGAKTSKFGGTWSRENGTILAIDEATWSAPNDDGSYTIWAPDVYQRSDGKFVMYFAATDKETLGQEQTRHCIGGAVSDSVEGVYHPESDFVQCNRTSTGAIDPAWFKDTDGKQYVVYKTEIPNNYLEIREVANSGDREGVEWVGNSQKLLKLNEQGYDDGGNMEAPFIFKRGNTYFLTYSTHYTGDGSYDVQYATASSLMGPYTRVEKPLVKTGHEHGCKLIGPGGASFERDSRGDEESVKIIFHALTEAMSMDKRVVYTATVQVDGNKLSVPTE